MKTMDNRNTIDKCYLEHCQIMIEFWKSSISVHDSKCLNEWNMFVNKCKEFHKRMLDNSGELDEAYSEAVSLGLRTEEEYNTQIKAFANEMSQMSDVASGKGWEW